MNEFPQDQGDAPISFQVVVDVLQEDVIAHLGSVQQFAVDIAEQDGFGARGRDTHDDPMEFTWRTKPATIQVGSQHVGIGRVTAASEHLQALRLPVGQDRAGGVALAGGLQHRQRLVEFPVREMVGGSLPPLSPDALWYYLAAGVILPFIVYAISLKVDQDRF